MVIPNNDPVFRYDNIIFIYRNGSFIHKSRYVID